MTAERQRKLDVDDDINEFESKEKKSMRRDSLPEEDTV